MRSPKQTVLLWVELFNRADADAVAALYHTDAINHQVVNEPIVGQEAIRQMFTREFAAAEMVCMVEHIFEVGEWAILEWKDPLGLRGCGFFFRCRKAGSGFSEVTGTGLVSSGNTSCPSPGSEIKFHLYDQQNTSRYRQLHCQLSTCHTKAFETAAPHY